MLLIWYYALRTSDTMQKNMLTKQSPFPWSFLCGAFFVVKMRLMVYNGKVSGCQTMNFRFILQTTKSYRKLLSRD